MAVDNSGPLMDQHLGALRDLRNMHVDAVMKTAGMVLIAIGWLVTSVNARDYLGSSALAKSVSFAAVVILLVSHIGGLWTLSVSSDRLMAEFDQANPVAATYHIERIRFVGSAILAVGLIGVLAVLVLLA